MNLTDTDDTTVKYRQNHTKTSVNSKKNLSIATPSSRLFKGVMDAIEKSIKKVPLDLMKDPLNVCPTGSRTSKGCSGIRPRILKSLAWNGLRRTLELSMPHHTLPAFQKRRIYRSK